MFHTGLGLFLGLQKIALWLICDDFLWLFHLSAAPREQMVFLLTKKGQPLFNILDYYENEGSIKNSNLVNSS